MHGMAMNYGMNRGMGGGPMPQRQGGGGNRRNNRMMRNSRFDQPHHNQHQQNNYQNNRGPMNNQQPNQPSVEIKPNVQNSPNVPAPKPVVAQPPPKPAQQTPPQAPVAAQPAVQPITPAAAKVAPAVAAPTPAAPEAAAAPPAAVQPQQPQQPRPGQPQPQQRQNTPQPQRQNLNQNQNQPQPQRQNLNQNQNQPQPQRLNQNQNQPQRQNQNQNQPQPQRQNLNQNQPQRQNQNQNQQQSQTQNPPQVQTQNAPQVQNQNQPQRPQQGGQGGGQQQTVQQQPAIQAQPTPAGQQQQTQGGQQQQTQGGQQHQQTQGGQQHQQQRQQQQPHQRQQQHQPQRQQQQQRYQNSQQQQNQQDQQSDSAQQSYNSSNNDNAQYQHGGQDRGHNQYQNKQQNMQFNRGGGGPRGNQGGFKRQMGGDKGPSGAGGNREIRNRHNMMEHMIVQKLRDIAGPTHELPPIDTDEVRFSGRSRLYVGNLTNDVTEQEFLEMFTPYGETAEVFINKEKNFAFIRMDHRLNAEKARRELDGSVRKGRPIRVRFAPHNSAIKVINLTPHVSNELLYRAFEVFGKIERAIVKVDERGKSLCEGIVEYARKNSAMAAIRYCTERCYFVTASLRPVIVEPFEEIDEVDGYPEKSMPRKNADYLRAREVGPRFADLSSFEHEYGTRWKQLHELYRQKEEALKAELADERDKLEAQMELARYEQETEMLREALRRREAERERAALRWSAAGERRSAGVAPSLAAAAAGLAPDSRQPEEEPRRRQTESSLFAQAQQLNSLLDQQEQSLGSYEGADGKRSSYLDQSLSAGMDGGYMDVARQFGSSDRAFDGGDLMGRWRHDDFPNKRRRY